MKLQWYLSRLRSMEPAEILHRLQEQVRKSLSRRMHQGWHRYPARPMRRILPHVPEAVRAVTEAQRVAIAAAAEAALAGHFHALGRIWPDRDPDELFPADVWRLDPVTGGTWPGAETYTFDIDFRHDGQRGDVKYVWEFNRLQALPPLAAQLLLTGDTRCGEAIAAAISSWHAANPPFGGVGWASGIEVALRSISLLLVVEIAGDLLDDDTWRKAGEMLVAAAYWLDRFPSRFSSANNHLVAELVAEYLIALAYGHNRDDLRGAIAAEAEKQILADGAGAEQSPTYAAFTVELILLAHVAAGRAGTPLAPIVEQRLAVFADFAAWLGPDLQGFGDDDEGRVVTLGDETDYPGSIAAAASAILGQPGRAVVEDGFCGVLFGTPAAASTPPTGLKTFPQGGLTIWRGTIGARNIGLAFDHGPLGYLSIAAHGHADALAVTLAIDGRPVLVDPGTWLYGSGGVWRSWFRSTPAHNTLSIGGESQSIMAGPFNWSRKADARLLDMETGPESMLRAIHDGYVGRFGCEHERIILRRPEGFEIRDRLIGGTHLCQIVFQLAEDLAAEKQDDRVIVRRDGTELLSLQMPTDSVRIARGGEFPGLGGWISRRFGTRVPADRIVWEGRVGDDGVVTGIVIA